MLEGRGAIEGERKQVTVMCADVVGSMALTHSLGSERWGYVLDRFLAVAATAVHKYEGTVSHFTGDGLLAVFGAPLAHEDHARRACLAILELRSALTGLAAETAQADGAEFAIRCGVNSGEVLVGEIGDDVHMDFVPIGNTTALGKRIETLAPVGSAAISAATASLVEGEFELRDLGHFDVKGSEQPQRLFELIGRTEARGRLEAAAVTRGLARFVGRERESEELDSALSDALAGHGRAVGITGDPGVGKSRLVREFVAGCATRGVSVYSSSCMAHGRNVPLLPLLALYRDFFGVSEHDAAEVARGQIEAATLALDPAFAADLPLLLEFIGVPEPDLEVGPFRPEERQHRLREVLARAIEARSRHEAAVVIVEDLHWIDDASAEFLETLVEAVVGTRILLVTTFRPEHEAAWASWSPHLQMNLDPLESDASGALLTELLGADASLDGLQRLIEERTAGNPFFAEEAVQALADAGHLAGERGGYRLSAEIEDLVLPPTVQAALAARIDVLPAREKALVQTMAVIGAEVPVRVLTEVSDLGQGELIESVEALTDAQMLVARGPAAEAEYAFKHPLTQNVAYESQLSARRARAHGEIASAIERVYPAGLDERAALLAHHYEASGDGLEAARWHARAAGWAERTSLAASLRHWRRARHLLSGLDPSAERDALASRAGVGVLDMSWRLGVTREETAEIRAEARTNAGEILPALVSAGTTMHSGREQEGLEEFRVASQRAVAGGDPGHVLTASLGVAYATWIAGSLREGLETVDRALAMADGDPTTGSGVAFSCPFAHAHGDRARCLGYMGEIETARHQAALAIELAAEHDDPESESAAHASIALVEAEVGEIEAALASAALGVAIAERAGNVVHVVACSTPAAVADAAAGRFAAALAGAESNLATIRRLGIGLYFEPLLLATVARSKLGLGEAAGGLAAAEEAVEIAGARGLTTCALSAPIALAEVLSATAGPGANERIESVLGRAMEVARASGAGAFEARIREGLGYL